MSLFQFHAVGKGCVQPAHHDLLDFSAAEMLGSTGQLFDVEMVRVAAKAL